MHRPRTARGSLVATPGDVLRAARPGCESYAGVTATPEQLAALTAALLSKPQGE